MPRVLLAFSAMPHRGDRSSRTLTNRSTLIDREASGLDCQTCLVRKPVFPVFFLERPPSQGEKSHFGERFRPAVGCRGSVFCPERWVHPNNSDLVSSNFGVLSCALELGP